MACESVRAAVLGGETVVGEMECGNPPPPPSGKGELEVRKKGRFDLDRAHARTEIPVEEVGAHPYVGSTVPHREKASFS